MNGTRKSAGAIWLEEEKQLLVGRRDEEELMSVKEEEAVHSFAEV